MDGGAKMKDLITAAEAMLDIAKLCDMEDAPATQNLKKVLTSVQDFQGKVDKLQKAMEDGRYGQINLPTGEALIAHKSKT